MYEIARNKLRRTGQALHALAGDFRGHALNCQQASRYPIVLMYHSVSQQAERDWGPWKYTVTPETFDQQLSRIEKEYTVISLNHFVKWMVDNKSIPHNSLVLTFDDAYCDFQNQALPILEKYEFQATVYAPTALLRGSSAPFEHRLGELLSEKKSIDSTVGDINIDTSLETEEKVIDCYNRIKNELKYSPVNYRERFFDAIEANPESTDVILNPEELRELQKHPLVTVGAHGHEHVPFAMLSEDKQKKNITKCRDQLTNVLGTPPRHFSYPYGSFNKSTIRAVKDAGFESAVTTQSRPISARDWGRPYTIPRIDAATETVVS